MLLTNLYSGFTGVFVQCCGISVGNAKIKVRKKYKQFVYMKKAAYSGFSFGASFSLLAVGAHIPIMCIGFKDYIEIMHCQ